MEDSFEKGDRVVLLDRPLGHPSKIKGVIAVSYTHLTLPTTPYV